MSQQVGTKNRAVWANIITLAGGAFVIGADGFMLAAVLPQMADQLGVGLDRMGWLVTVFAWTYALSAPLLGVWLGRHNRRTIIALALLIFAIGNGLVAVAVSYEWAMVGRVVAALGSAMFMPTAMALATNLAPTQHRGKAISTITTGMTLATVLAVPLGAMVGEHYGFRLLFWAMGGGALMIIGLVLWLIRLADARATLAGRPSLSLLLAALKQRSVALTLVVTVLIFMAGMSVAAYLSAIVQQAGLSSAFSLILLVFGLGSLAGGLVAGWLTDRYQGPWLLRISTIIFGLSLVSLAMVATWRTAVWLVCLVVLSWCVSAWVAGIAQQYRLVALDPRRAQLNLSLNSSSIYLGQGFGGALGSIIISHQPASVIPLAAAVMLVVGLVLTGGYEIMTPDESS